MEVHHHSHSQRKKWTHYLWEFLMLFLAVFSGFLAEYQLEHYIEKQRAAEFAVSLHRDLAGDTTEINQVNNRIQDCISDIDSLTLLLDGDGDLKRNSINVYKYSVNAFGYPQFQANESTLQQLLNSGSLRYFKNSTLVDSIKFYNLSIQQNAEFAFSTYQFGLEFRKIQIQLLKIDLITQAMVSSNAFYSSNGNKDRGYNLSVFSDQALLSYDPQKIKDYSNWCALKKFYFINSLKRYKRQKETAISLMALLKKSYDIK